MNTIPGQGTRYCRVFRISFIVSIVTIFLSIIMVIYIADIIRNPPSPIQLENMKENPEFYTKYIIMPLLAMLLLAIHLVFFILFNIYLKKIVSMIGESSVFYLTVNVLTMPLGSIYVFFRIRKFAIEKGLWH